MILIIDNYDSFTYNLVSYFKILKQEVLIFRNDSISLNEIKSLNPNVIVISPGPCSPLEAGISCEVVNYFKGLIPILGVCLGHQVIGHVFGSQIIRAPIPMHGKTSIIKHNGDIFFSNIPTNFTVARYHSLIIDRRTLGNNLEILAICEDSNLIMAVKHKLYPVYGVQFHPESIASEYGLLLLTNFLKLVL